jgi:Fe-S cluster assembly iron-binding protein IscA
MLTVTPAACERLTRKLVGKKAGEDQAMRFTRKPGGWKLSVDRAKPADTTITHEGKVVLLLDEAASQAMTNSTLDVKDDGAGPRLDLH